MGIESTVRSHEYRDKSIDGELSVFIERGQDASDIMKRVEEAFGTENIRQTWMSLGVRFGVAKGDLEQAETRYDRHKGMFEAWMYWRQMFRRTSDESERKAQIIDPFGRMESQVIPGIQDEYDRKVHQIIVRLHWNPNGDKPDRD